MQSSSLGASGQEAGSFGLRPRNWEAICFFRSASMVGTAVAMVSVRSCGVRCRAEHHFFAEAGDMAAAAAPLMAALAAAVGVSGAALAATAATAAFCTWL